MTDKEKLQAFKENLFDIRRCIDEELREKEYNNYEQ